MNTRRTILFAFLLAGKLAAIAETVWNSSDDASSPFRQRIGLGYRMNFNMSAKFGNVGGMIATSNPGPATGSNVDRTYDDGFNRVDVSGNAGGQTWFWGYTDASQIVGDTVVMHSRSVSSTSSEETDDPQHGTELTYNIELGATKSWRWGMEAGASYTAFNVTNSKPMSGNVVVISDAFALNGVVPPMAPYSGTFNGPGPMISSTPVRTISTTPGGATITGERALDADLFGFRLGPYLEIPIASRMALSFSGGLAVVVVSSDFRFHETVTIPGSGSTSRSGSGNDDAVLAGGYLSGNLSYALTDRVSLFGGVQYYVLGDQEQTANRKSATLDLGSSVGVLLGATFSF